MATPPLNALLDAYRAYSEAGLDSVTAEVFAREAELMRRPDWRARRLGVGDPAPDVVLPDSGDDSVRLSQLWRDAPLIVKFYRGRWCPYCTLDLRAWQRALPDLRSRGARLLAVSPQGENEIALTRERDRLDFQIVSDPRNAIARAFGVAYVVEPDVRRLYDAQGIAAAQIDDSGTWTLPLPSCFLIDRAGRIAWAHVDADYRRRADPADVTAQLARIAAA